MYCSLFVTCFNSQPALCPQRSTFKDCGTRLLWFLASCGPWGYTSRSSEGKRRGGTRESISQWLLLLPRGLGQRQHPPTSDLASLWWPFPHSSGLSHSFSLPARPKYCSACPLLKPSFSPQWNISLLSSLLIPFEVPSASCWNPGNVAEDAVVRMEKINSLSSWNLLPESNEGVGMRPLANRKLNKRG